MNRGRRGENRLWKRVTPTVTEFAWLPPNLAESFCKNALYRDAVRTYCAFDTPHLGLDTKNFVADVFVENILYLGDTRSADDLSVFCLGCGLRVFFWLVAAWVKSRAERPSVSVVNRQLHVQIGCKLGIRNRKDELEASKAKQITN